MHTILKYLKSNFFQEQSFYYPDLVEANGFLLQLSPGTDLQYLSLYWVLIVEG